MNSSIPAQSRPASAIKAARRYSLTVEEVLPSTSWVEPSPSTSRTSRSATRGSTDSATSSERERRSAMYSMTSDRVLSLVNLRSAASKKGNRKQRGISETVGPLIVEPVARCDSSCHPLGSFGGRLLESRLHSFASPVPGIDPMSYRAPGLVAEHAEDDACGDQVATFKFWDNGRCSRRCRAAFRRLVAGRLSQWRPRPGRVQPWVSPGVVLTLNRLRVQLALVKPSRASAS